LTCINALVIAEGHESPDKDVLFQTMTEKGLKRFVRVSRPHFNMSCMDLCI